MLRLTARLAPARGRAFELVLRVGQTALVRQGTTQREQVLAARATTTIRTCLYSVDS